MAKFRKGSATLLLVAGLTLVAGGSASAVTTLVACGHVINTTGEKLVLGNNLKDCPGSGIIVAASNVTIDLNGHRISGVDAAGSGGVLNNGGHPNVTIHGGAISDFETGILTTGLNPLVRDVVVTDNKLDGISVSTGTDGRIERTTVARNEDDGIVVAGSDRLALVGNTAVRNKDDGIEVGTSASPKLTGNRSLGNLASGLFLNGVSDPVVRSNRLSLNRVDGLIAQLVTGARIERNTVIGNDITGVRVWTDATSNTVAENRITGNGGNGVIVAEDSNVVRENNASANNDHGIWIQGGMFNRVLNNKADENGVDGIQLSAQSHVVGNHVHKNGWLNGLDDTLGLGVDDDAASTGHSNSAAHNDDFDQCESSSPGLCDRGSGAAPGPLVTCGTGLIKPIRIINNLVNCPSHGLEIIRNGVDLNLGGHRIDGNFADFGVASLSGHSGTTIRNGVIGNFQRQIHIESGIGTPKNITIKGIYTADDGNFISAYAIRLEDVEGASVSGNTLLGPGAGAVVGGTSRDVTISNNLIAAISGAGAGENSSQVTISRNTVVGTAHGIFAGDGVEGVTMSGNKLVGVLNAGVQMGDAPKARVSNNTIVGTGEGVRLFEADKITIAANTARANEGDGIVVDASTNIRVLGNVLSGNHGRGVLITNGATALVRDNRVTANGSHGIDTVSAAGRISDNVANANGFLSAPGAPSDGSGLGVAGNIATQGSGNRAKGNDDPAQCSPDHLC